MTTAETAFDSAEQPWPTEQFDPAKPSLGTTWDSSELPLDFNHDMNHEFYDFGHIHNNTAIPPSASPHPLWSSAFEPVGFGDSAQVSPSELLYDQNLVHNDWIPFPTSAGLPITNQPITADSPLATLIPVSWAAPTAAIPAIPGETQELHSNLITVAEGRPAPVPARPRNARRKSSTTKARIKPYEIKTEDSTRTITRKPIDPSFRSCWRCKKYRKPCDENTVCNGCLMTSGFRVWPSTLGCKRGNMHEFAYLIIPTSNTESLKEMNFDYVKPFSWRQTPLTYPQESSLVQTDPSGDIWDRIICSIRSTNIHGPGIIELLEICASFQRKQRKPQPALREGALTFYTVIQLYHSLVSTSSLEPFDTTVDIEKKFIDVRKSLMAAMDKYVHSCLTGKLKAWPPTLLTCSLLVLTYMYLADAVAALPWLVRTNTWADVKSMVMNLRNGLYVMARDLLLALAKGVRMLDMGCWRYEETDGSKVRNSQGMKMMDDDESAFDTMVELIEWRERFLNLLNGDTWLANTPFDIDLPIVMSLARLFNVSAVAKTST